MAALRQARAAAGIITLQTVISRVKPTVLVGCSTAHGAFTQQLVETMSAGVERPVIFPISNPTSQIEAMPADIIAWSKGQALVATGLPIPPVDYAGGRYLFGEANNALLYPGLGLGTIVSGASEVTDGMPLAAAEAVAGQADVSAPGRLVAALAVENLRASSATTAVAVARAAADDGVATTESDDLVQTIQDAIWQPVYPDSVLRTSRYLGVCRGRAGLDASSSWHLGLSGSFSTRVTSYPLTGSSQGLRTLRIRRRLAANDRTRTRHSAAAARGVRVRS